VFEDKCYLSIYDPPFTHLVITHLVITHLVITHLVITHLVITHLVITHVVYDPPFIPAPGRVPSQRRHAESCPLRAGTKRGTLE
jgi:hypothetical protein